MIQYIDKLALVVAAYQEAIDYYCGKLKFELLEDSDMRNGKRWVVVRPPGGRGPSLLLAKAKNDEEAAAVGSQTGGRVFLFLHTDDFWRDYEQMKQAGVDFTEEPREEDYGTVIVFRDLYGNKWDLIEPKGDS